MSIYTEDVGKTCLVPRRLSRYARKGRREGDNGPPMVPCGVSPVTRFALASAMRKTKRLRRRLRQDCVTSVIVTKIVYMNTKDFTVWKKCSL